MLVYEETQMIFIARVEAKLYRKKLPFCLCARTNQALHALITHKILHSKDAQFKTEESP